MTRKCPKIERRPTWQSTDFSHALEKLPSFREIEEVQENVETYHAFVSAKYTTKQEITETLESIRAMREAHQRTMNRLSEMEYYLS
jgi:hypothetical protein